MAVLVSATLACTPARTEPVRADVAAEASAPAPVRSEIDAGPLPTGQALSPPQIHAYSYEALCGDVTRLDAGTTSLSSPASAPSAGASVAVGRPAVDVRFGSKVSKQLFHLEIVAPSLHSAREVYVAAAEDPFECCGRKEGASLVFVCGASGIDIYTGRGSARQEGDELVIRWCTATPQRVQDRGEERVPLHGATPRFVATKADCP